MHLSPTVVARTQLLLAEIDVQIREVGNLVKNRQWITAEKAFLSKRLWRNIWKLLDAPTPEVQLIVAKIRSRSYDDEVMRIVKNLQQLGHAITARP